MSNEVVRRVAQENPELLQINTYESCFQFVLEVIRALNVGADGKYKEIWGLTGKTAGESQYTPDGWKPTQVGNYVITGFSHDAIKNKLTGQVVDTLGNSAANSDAVESIHGPAQVYWNEIPPEHWRPNNPFVSVSKVMEVPAPSAPKPQTPTAPAKPSKSREQLTKEVIEVNEFYKSDLKRPGGLVIDWEPVAGSPYPVKADVEAIASWLFNLTDGWTVEQCKAKIRESSEWKIKNQNGG